jgi:hypothetical protein
VHELPILALGRCYIDTLAHFPVGTEAAAKDTENHTLPVMNELILLLLQKGVLNEAEGKSLLQKLKEKRSWLGQRADPLSLGERPKIRFA